MPCAACTSSPTATRPPAPPPVAHSGVPRLISWRLVPARRSTSFREPPQALGRSSSTVAAPFRAHRAIGEPRARAMDPAAAAGEPQRSAATRTAVASAAVWAPRLAAVPLAASPLPRPGFRQRLLCGPELACDRLQQLPPDHAVALDQRLELPQRDAVADQLGRGRDGRDPGALVEQGDLSEVVARA